MIGRLKENAKVTKDVERLAGKWNYIKPNHLNAYKLSNGRNGTDIQTLFDKETGEILDSYIVSPERQKIPNIHSNEEKELAKKLIRGSKRRPEDMFQLIHFVKVVASQKKLAESGRQMISSGRAPVELD